MGRNLEDVEMYILFESLAEAWNKPEHADRAGQGARVAEHMVGPATDPVTAGCGITAITGHDRLARLEQFYLAFDRGGSLDASARAVDAEHDGLH